MKVTKYLHACVTLELDDHQLVIDPGSFSTDFIAPEHVDAIIITHAHGDHYDPDLISAIHAKNPEVILYGPEDVITKLPDHNGVIVHAGETITVGPFTVEFLGGQHALVHPSIPAITNLAIMVNDLFYYPGDSLFLPIRPVDTLAVPVSAPWLKLSEVMDFMSQIKPRLAFPIHDALNSEVATGMVDRMLQQVAADYGSEYMRLTDSIEI